MKSYRVILTLAVLTLGLALGCQQPSTDVSGDGWTLVLRHTSDGTVKSGENSALVSAIRQGCQIRVAWGARRAADSTRTIEHSAEPIWINLRDGTDVEVQIGDFVANQGVLGEPEADHPRRERFGGTSKAVKWRAALKTDGSFDAIWYYPHSGELVTRIPQNHPMSWYADCAPGNPEPLFD